MSTRAAALTITALLALSACTAPEPAPDPTAEPAPDPVRVAQTSLPEQDVTVLEQPDAVGRALAATRTFYDAAPVVVLAAEEDVDAQLAGASVAVRLGMPLLLVPDGSAGTRDGTEEDTEDEGAAGADEGATGPAEVAEELSRLETVTVVTVGEVDVPGGTDVTTVPHEQVGDLLDGAETVEVEPGREVRHVAELDRDEPRLLQHEDDEGTGEAEQTTAHELPATEPAAPLTEAMLLTTGDTADLAAVATARAAGVPVVRSTQPDPRATSRTVEALADAEVGPVVALGHRWGAPEDLGWKIDTARTGVQLPGGGQTLFPGKRMIALYGTPHYPALGLLGEQDVEESIDRARRLAAEYEPLTDDVVVPAFEIIVTVASRDAGADEQYSNRLPVDTFVPWVEAARDAGVYVVIDLQPGRTDFLTQARLYEELLLYPNVGLALDPEWRLEPDQVHLRQIGSVEADEVNEVVDYLADLTRENALPQKLLILHQFRLSMIQDRDDVDTSREEIAVMIHADGQGSQPAKQDTWRALRASAPEGIWWGWKNFIDEDTPMLTPEQTFRDVEPVPHFVSYQ
ncbi:YdgH/BhsA/McbA family protein [Cellulomonas bogoriensis]|uniref:Lipoprotein n=1 Tax=Cellulomonas bogoriensis 69B4 = DSM 16987 TaxID=1386082 RepID=A0A0A0C0Z7_9CELL|nr:hypothetical protein [Cellulomonas bogoriensis]KGM13840.1 hypothetical protein N869_09075 [Cellulomonas bogoriensis 69B4 = DSM 16987]